MGGVGLAKSSFNFIQWLKMLNLQFILLYLRYMLGEGLFENVLWGERVG